MRTGGVPAGLEDVSSISLNSMDPTNLYDMFNGLLRDSGFGVSNNFNIF